MNNATPTEQAWTRVRDLYHGLAVPMRLGIAIVVGLAIVGAGYWGMAPREADSVYLLGGQEFNDAQIQSFCRALESEGLSGFRVEGSRL